ncbi:hypothetical protein, partial [Lacticaseibacillus rhamnosus]|uniref:hypothetical protein n=1 Tax=Lacticaseibacillus rhamnosus TaxID=47715 RepID=UPI003F480C16
RDISATARFSEKRLRQAYSMTPVQLTDLCEHCGGIPGCVAGQRHTHRSAGLEKPSGEPKSRQSKGSRVGSA